MSTASAVTRLTLGAPRRHLHRPCCSLRHPPRRRRRFRAPEAVQVFVNSTHARTSCARAAIQSRLAVRAPINSRPPPRKRPPPPRRRRQHLGQRRWPRAAQPSSGSLCARSAHADRSVIEECPEWRYRVCMCMASLGILAVCAWEDSVRGMSWHDRVEDERIVRAIVLDNGIEPGADLRVVGRCVGVARFDKNNYIAAGSPHARLHTHRCDARSRQCAHARRRITRAPSRLASSRS